MKTQTPFIFTFLCLIFACQTDKVSKPFLLQTDMGSLTIQMYPMYSALAEQIQTAVKGDCGSVPLLSLVHQDLCIGLDLPCGGEIALPDRLKHVSHLRGTLFLLEDAPRCRLFIVQGKPQTATALEAWGSTHGKAYSDADRNRYLKYGGSPMFDGKGYPVGVVVEGLEVIDKLAAVPTNAERKPLQPIAFRYKSL